MANVINTGTSAKKQIKPSYIVVTEFTGEENAGALAAGDAYILEDVIEDTTSISQDENETTTIECETSDSPIVEIVKLGKWQFAAELGDTQKDLLKALVGFTKVGTQYAVAPRTYKKKYVTVAVVFENEGDDAGYYAYVVPRLQLNSRVTIESLNSNLARIALAGTAQDTEVDLGGDSNERTAFYIDEAYVLPTAG